MADDPRFAEITPESIARACEEIYSGMFRDFRRSTKYSVRYKTAALPPKAVISRAYFHSTGRSLPVQGDAGFYGGRQSNEFLESHGYTIIEEPSDH